MAQSKFNWVGKLSYNFILVRLQDVHFVCRLFVCLDFPHVQNFHRGLPTRGNIPVRERLGQENSLSYSERSEKCCSGSGLPGIDS